MSSSQGSWECAEPGLALSGCTECRKSRNMMTNSHYLATQYPYRASGIGHPILSPYMDYPETCQRIETVRHSQPLPVKPNCISS
ncbi:Hypothetical predicted protein [Pelobates cultripes]|uniref:Uncharacterized protein n=1 Tax=Pelobates cultripes TaxID=61616 RepID=A0AAD1VPR9_PELCU|nr:Hypothetical predicted protein [Pelobates cultripes]